MKHSPITKCLAKASPLVIHPTQSKPSFVSVASESNIIKIPNNNNPRYLLTSLLKFLSNIISQTNLSLLIAVLQNYTAYTMYISAFSNPYYHMITISLLYYLYNNNITSFLFGLSLLFRYRSLLLFYSILYVMLLFTYY